MEDKPISLIEKCKKCLNEAASYYAKCDFNKCMQLIEALRIIDPTDWIPYNNLSYICNQLERYEEAVEYSLIAMELSKGETGDTYYNLGVALANQGRLDESNTIYRQALDKYPEYHEIKYNLALNLLMSGDLKSGFELYESRFDACKRFTLKGGLDIHTFRMRFHKPHWCGEEINGKILFVYCEQGFGDSIQFSRYLPLIENMGINVIVECREELLDLYKKSFPFVQSWLTWKHSYDQDGNLSPQYKPLPPHDYVVSMSSLPHVFKTRLDTIPKQLPYIQYKPNNLKLKLNHDKLNIGFCWYGSQGHGNDHKRSLPIKNLSPLFNYVNAYAIHKNQGNRVWCDQYVDLCENIKSMKIKDLSGVLYDFNSTAEIISQLDAVVSVDTSLVHLAGSLGLKTYLILPYQGEWRWMSDKVSSWYPTIQIIRQKQINDWESVIKQLEEIILNG